VIRLSSIGDIVLTSPVVRCLKTRFPEAEIHYLTKSVYVPILQCNPSVFKVWEFRNNFKELIPLLKNEGFDFIVDLHKNLRSLYVRLHLRKPSSSFHKLNLQKWLLVNMRIDLLPKVHVVDRYFEALKPLEILNDGKGLEYFIPPGEDVLMDTLPGDFRNGYIAFVIGGKHATKILPEEKVVHICNRLNSPVILMGGKEDAEKGDQISGKITKTAVLNACGKYSINRSASLIRQATKVITNDTGLMHIAAAFRKPIVSVWGNTVPEFGMYPYLPEGSKENLLIAEVKGLSCRPCSKLGYPRCPKKHFRCMNDLDFSAIINKLNNQ
jgi:ADP-heptose:LPS heptosyltransferase